MKNDGRRIDVCTIFEKHLHYGAGALINSLYSGGFRGDIWAGFRGNPPPWVLQSGWRPGEAEEPYEPASGIRLHLIPLETDRHLGNYKPIWMKTAMERMNGDVDGVAYFDPDVLVNCSWAFVEEWCQHGIAVCEDVNYHMGVTHPVRLKWRAILEQHGIAEVRDLSGYINSGFIGICRERSPLLRVWEEVIDIIAATVGNLDGLKRNDRTHWYWAMDQDALNMALMAVAFPISVVGPDGMGFAPGGSFFSHAVGNPKPWTKAYLRSALKGLPPTRAERGYWRNAAAPIRLYSSKALALNRIKVATAAAIGRVIKRS